MAKSKSAIVKEAESCLGIPYVYGGNNPLQGLDCSGLVCWVLKRFGMVKTAQDFSAAQLHTLLTTLGATSLETPEAGALLFFGRKQITHIAIAIGSARMIEAGGGDHTTTNPALAAKAGAMVRRQMISSRADLYGILMPPWPDVDDLTVG